MGNVVPEACRSHSDLWGESLDKPGRYRAAVETQKYASKPLCEESLHGHAVGDDKQHDRAKCSQTNSADDHCFHSSNHVAKFPQQRQRNRHAEQECDCVDPERPGMTKLEPGPGKGTAGCTIALDSPLNRRINDIVHEDRHPHERDVKSSTPQHRHEGRRHKRSEVFPPQCLANWMLWQFLQPLLGTISLRPFSSSRVVLTLVWVMLDSCRLEKGRDEGDQQTRPKRNSPTKAAGTWYYSATGGENCGSH